MNARSASGDGRDFDFLLGEWRVEHTYLRRRLTGCLEWDRFEGTATCQPLPGGLGNVDHLWMPSRQLHGCTVRLFDPPSGSWSLHWTSSASRHFEPPVVGAFEDGRGVFEGDDEHAGRPIRVRYVWDRVGRRTARWRQLFSGDAGASWELNWTMQFHRDD